MSKTKNLKTTTEYPCGQTITTVRTMTDSEMLEEGWERDHWSGINPTCFVLSDGSILYPSRDEEGNGPGIFFGVVDGSHIALTLSERVS